MADDKRNGDDLFEDLDKFFAPIKDVDWDEPASAGAQETPDEEHVAVRSGIQSTRPLSPSPSSSPSRPHRSRPSPTMRTMRTGTTPRSWTRSKVSPSATSRPVAPPTPRSWSSTTRWPAKRRCPEAASTSFPVSIPRKRDCSRVARRPRPDGTMQRSSANRSSGSPTPRPRPCPRSMTSSRRRSS